MSSISWGGGSSNQNGTGVRWKVKKVKNRLCFWRKGEKRRQRSLCPYLHVLQPLALQMTYFLAS